jgi:hypothetical protein
MKLGDLVKLKNIPGVLRVYPDISVDTVGLIMSWVKAGEGPWTNYGGEGEILWPGKIAIAYEEDLELVNEGR